MSPQHDRTPPPSDRGAGPGGQSRPARPRRTGRRRFLLWGGATVGLGLAGAAGAFAYGRQLFGEAAPAMRDHRVSLPDTMPRLVVARGPDPAANVAAVLQRMGGMRAFVGPDDRVLVKPNIGFDQVPALAATTDPTVVAAVVRACREAGAREVWVADCPAVLDPATAYEASGIHRAAHGTDHRGDGPRTF